VEINKYISSGVITNKSGTGSVDVLGTITPNVAEIWDVKPPSYETGGTNHSAGIAQVKGYVEAIKNGGYSGASFAIVGGSRISGRSEFLDETGKFLIQYKNQLDGLIIYRFRKKPDDPKKDKSQGVPIIGEKPEDNSKNKDNKKDNIIEFPQGEKQKQEEKKQAPAAASPGIDWGWVPYAVGVLIFVIGIGMMIYSGGAYQPQYQPAW
jgi:hypothetical protein